MAVLQISRIQQRRGLQQDLPQLASAELGWSIDQRRLFIGNGLLGEGAPIQGVTEILTQHTDLVDVIKWYTFKGHEGGFISQTGPTISAPTVRTLQNKFDDFVSVRDFGAVGDGVTNDIDAIYRALTEIYKSSEVVNNSRARRTIYFPAGTYRVAPSTEHTYGVLVIPPWCRIVGDGIDNTHIIGNSVYNPMVPGNTDCVIRFSDTAFVYDQTNIGTTPWAVMPTDVSIEQLSLAHSSNKDIVYIDNAINLHFTAVQFIGSIVDSPLPTEANGAVTFASSKVSPDNITFESCKFKQLKYAVIAAVDAKNVRFNNCLFENMWSAFRLGQTSNPNKPTNFRITNSVFRRIGNVAIDCYAGVSGIISSGNSFYNCGNNLNGPLSPVVPFITFRGTGNYSINDSFDRAAGTILQVSFSRVRNIQIESNSGIRLGQAVYGMGDYYTLPIGLSTFTADNITAGAMTYQVTDGTNYRTGTVVFTPESYQDTFASDAVFDTFAISVNSGIVTCNTPVTGVLSFSINHI
jgi:hypothetical protein